MKMPWEQDIQYIITEESHPQKMMATLIRRLPDEGTHNIRMENFFMNNAAVDSNIERNFQQTEIYLSKMLLQICGLS